MSEIPQEALDRAVEATMKAHYPDDRGPTTPSLVRADLEASGLFAAGFEEGIKKAREVVEDRSGFEVTRDHGVEGRKSGYLINRPSLLHVLAALDSGLSDSQKQVEDEGLAELRPDLATPTSPPEHKDLRRKARAAVTTNPAKITHKEEDENLD